MTPVRAVHAVGLALAAVAAAAVTVPVPDHGHAATLPIPASAVVDGHPATWPACATIGYTLNTTAAPAGAAQDVLDVLAELTAHTGLRFAYRGTTTRMPQTGDLDRGPVDPRAPLTIAWSTHPTNDAGTAGTVSNLLAGSAETAGRAVTTDEYRPRRGLLPPRHLIVAADVVIDARLTRDVDGSSWGGHSGQRAFLAHELAHAVGLDHTTHIGSVLAPQLPTGAYRAYPEFDQAALRALAAQAGPC